MSSVRERSRYIFVPIWMDQIDLAWERLGLTPSPTLQGKYSCIRLATLSQLFRISRQKRTVSRWRQLTLRPFPALSTKSCQKSEDLDHRE